MASSKNAKYSFDADEVCPICKNNRYLTPNMKLLVSDCYHKMCESCIDRLFANGAGPCPICQKILRKVSFIEPTFEDLRVEKEVKVRRMLSKQYNQRQEDFESLRLYNDYLEMVEEIAWNLINDKDKKETEALMNKHLNENRDIIARNRRKQEEEAKKANYFSEKVKIDKRMKFESYKKELDEEKKRKEREEAELIEELAKSKGSAAAILAEKKAMRESSRSQEDKSPQQHYPSPGDSNLSSWYSGNLESTSFMEDSQEFDAIASEYLDIGYYTLKDKYYDPYTETNTKLRAGGFSPKFLHERALQAAFSGLFSFNQSDDMNID
ncbi:CDK-activating kinase assembly factor [Rhizophagus irregularis]|uniref:RNA polymerase II transcription factor B subunit 3 n=1 Tax=Rhizophagus irregularis TaxID=588596 RepID=A0A2I1GAR2_9GLOM|nr:CDK-activating kinase assembly factor [Rhizophagus irregularis]